MGEARTPRRLGRARRENVVGGRTMKVEVYVTVEEKAALIVRAKGLGITVPRLLFESAMAEGGEAAFDRRGLGEELFGIRQLLSAVSNNVNQIARHANSTGTFPADAGAAVAAAERLMARIDGAVRQLLRP